MKTEDTKNENKEIETGEGADSMNRISDMNRISNMKLNKGMFLRFLLPAVLVAIFINVSACGKAENPDTVMIAEQYGLAYAPLQIMKEKGFLEEENLKVKWVQLSNTAAIREAVISEDLDIGFMGIPPYIIGVDNGMDWRIFCGLSESPVGLVTNKEEIKSLADFTGEDKIVLPQPGSIQHILLAMACEKELGKADVFDHQIISMSHPDGYQAMITDPAVSGHYTAPPYLFKELKEPKNHLVVSGRDAVGEDFTFIAGVCTKSFYEKKDLYNAVKTAIAKSIQYMEENPEDTLEILAKAYGMEQQELDGYLREEGMVYTTEVKGISHFIEFMHRNGYIKKEYELPDLLWE